MCYALTKPLPGGCIKKIDPQLGKNLILYLQK